MIFAHTICLALAGRKTQTLRLAYPGDRLLDSGGILAESSADIGARVIERPFDRHGKGELYSRPRWIVGHTYAIQPERCHRAKGRFRCTYLRAVRNPLDVDLAFAQAEGFDSLEEWRKAWTSIHPQPIQRAWAIGMEIMEAATCATEPHPTAWPCDRGRSSPAGTPRSPASR